jgi:transcriptional regulator with XRE-family HTH domain
MKLDRWLKRKKMTPEAFAALIEVHETTVYRFLQGLVFPKSGNLRKIAEVTDGAVQANDFLNVRRPPPDGSGRGRPRKDPTDEIREAIKNAQR